VSRNILTLKIYSEPDLVIARQRTRLLAKLLGFELQDQTKIATAVSEICRNAFQYAGGAMVKFSLDEKTPQGFSIQVSDRGQGISNLKDILDGKYTSATGLGLGLLGARRLMDRFEIESIQKEGTTVLLGKNLPKKMPLITSERLGQIADELAKFSPKNLLEETRQQNQELLQALAQLRRREDELLQTNRDLKYRNLEVMALYVELDEKAESLKRADQLKTQFLSTVSHEFRTPLYSIISLSSMLLSLIDGKLTSEQEKQVSFIRQGAQELSNLVDDLLDLAKIESGKIDVRSNRFAVRDIFDTLRGMLAPMLANNSYISLRFEHSEDIPSLYTDKNKVAQILINLIFNSLKYTESGEIKVAALNTGNVITFSVTDTGIGIAPEELEKIFEKFVQLDSPLQKRLKGTGLGLPLSRQLAQLLGGSVSVISELGVGSTFFVKLPIIYLDTS